MFSKPKGLSPKFSWHMLILYSQLTKNRISQNQSQLNKQNCGFNQHNTILRSFRPLKLRQLHFVIKKWTPIFVEHHLYIYLV